MQMIRDGKYIGETGICRNCYQEMAKDKTTCFGKTDKAIGYDATKIECSQFCPDKKVCKEFVTVS